MTACRLLTRPNLQKALQARQSADAAKLSLRREDVLAGLLEAVNQARVQSNPMGMIAGLREIGKMMGFYAVETKRVDVNVAGRAQMARLDMLSDAELIKMVEAGRAAL